MYFKKSVIFILCLLLLAGLNACGSKGSESQENQALLEAETSEEPASSEEFETPNFTGDGPIGAAVDDPYEEVVASPMGAVEHTLPAENTMDYLLEKYRMPKWEWTENADGTISYRGKTYKRNSYVKALLLMGIDTQESLHYEPDMEKRGCSDGIFLVARDTARNKMKVLMLPRDTITEIYEYTEDGIFKGEALNHLCLAYSQLPDPSDGCSNAAGATMKFLCDLEIDETAAIGLNVLAELTDAVDGVDVTVPNDQLQITEPTWTEGTKLHLTGENVEKFLRFRDFREQQEDEGPIIRMSQHKQYLSGYYKAVRNKAKTDSNIISRLYDILEDEMVTTMTKGEILSLGAEALSCEFTMDDIQIIPGIEDHEGRNFTEYYGDYEELIPLILELFYRQV